MMITLTDGDMKISAGYLPERTKPCLWIYTTPCSIRKVASFNDWESAELFMDYLSKMIGAIKK